MKFDDDTPPESHSFRKLVIHVIDEMPWGVVAAVVFLAFFFVYGMLNSLLKLFGYDVASLDFPLGAAAGGIAAGTVLLACVAIKLRKK